MRKIKFRAWDKENKKWLIYKQRIVGWTCPLSGDYKSVEMWVYESPDGLSFNELQFCLQSEQFDVCRFSELLDKARKEIYEGDVVCFWEEKHIIAFHRGCFGWEEDGLFFCLRHIHSGTEVIGNIYENPELIAG